MADKTLKTGIQKQVPTFQQVIDTDPEYAVSDSIAKRAKAEQYFKDYQENTQQYKSLDELDKVAYKTQFYKKYNLVEDAPLYYKAGEALGDTSQYLAEGASWGSTNIADRLMNNPQQRMDAKDAERLLAQGLDPSYKFQDSGVASAIGNIGGGFAGGTVFKNAAQALANPKKALLQTLLQSGVTNLNRTIGGKTNLAQGAVDTAVDAASSLIPGSRGIVGNAVRQGAGGAAGGAISTYVGNALNGVKTTGDQLKQAIIQGGAFGAGMGAALPHHHNPPPVKNQQTQFKGLATTLTQRQQRPVVRNRNQKEYQATQQHLKQTETSVTEQRGTLAQRFEHINKQIQNLTQALHMSDITPGQKKAIQEQLNRWIQLRSGVRGVSNNVNTAKQKVKASNKQAQSEQTAQRQIAVDNQKTQNKIMVDNTKTQNKVTVENAKAQGTERKETAKQGTINARSTHEGAKQATIKARQEYKKALAEHEAVKNNPQSTPQQKAASKKKVNDAQTKLKTASDQQKATTPPKGTKQNGTKAQGQKQQPQGQQPASGQKKQQPAQTPGKPESKQKETVINDVKKQERDVIPFKDKDGNQGYIKVSVDKEGENTHILVDAGPKGHARFSIREQGGETALHPEDLFVDEKSRRKGVATAIYDAAKERTGLEISKNPSEQSESGSAFRENYDQKPAQKTEKLPGNSKVKDIVQNNQVEIKTGEKVAQEPKQIRSSIKASGKAGETVVIEYEAEKHGETGQYRFKTVHDAKLDFKNDGSVMVRGINEDGQITTYLEDDPSGSRIVSVERTGEKNRFTLQTDSETGKKIVVNTETGETVPQVKREGVKSNELRAKAEKVKAVADKLKTNKPVTKDELIQAANEADDTALTELYSETKQQDREKMHKDLTDGDPCD